MYALTAFFAIDGPIGRFDRMALSDQTMMEMLAEDLSVHFKKWVYNRRNGYKDACTWSGVTCDGDGRVVEISLNAHHGTANLCYIPHEVASFALRGQHCEGTVETHLLPAKLRKFTVPTQKLSGTLDMTKLPDTLISFDISRNEFTGSFDLQVLPALLEELKATSNQLSGEIVLTSLPESLRVLYLGSNNFSGEVRLDMLPNCLQRLAFHKNELSGEPCFSALPPSLAELTLNANKFCGDFLLKEPPAALRRVAAAENNFSGTAVIASRLFVPLKGNSIDAVIDESGNAHPKEYRILSKKAL